MKFILSSSAVCFVDKCVKCIEQNGTWHSVLTRQCTVVWLIVRSPDPGTNRFFWLYLLLTLQTAVLHIYSILTQRGRVMHICIYMCVCVYMRHQTTRPALDYIMACRLVSEPMLFYWQLGHWEHISLKSNSKFINFHSRKYIWKYRLFCLGLYIHVKLGLGCWWQCWVKKHNVFFETPLCLVISNHRCGPDDIIQNGRRDLAKYRGTCRYSPWTRELITVAAADKDINLEGLGWWGPFQVCPKSRTHEIG